MFKTLSIITLILFSQLSFAADVAVSTTAPATEISDEKKAVIDELLEITGALEVATIMGDAAANQMLTAIQRTNGQIPPEVVAIIRDETHKIMQEEFVDNGFISEVSYVIYDRHFTTAELQEVVDFYKSPTGAKVARLMPQVTQEAMIESQKHMQTLRPIIQQRFTERFEAEGIK